MSKKKRRAFSQAPFGESVEQLMGETGTTYRALAQKTHLSAGYLNHIVHGNRPVPDNAVIASVARALGVETKFFREYRIRCVTERLESDGALADRLYRRL